MRTDEMLSLYLPTGCLLVQAHESGHYSMSGAIQFSSSEFTPKEGVEHPLFLWDSCIQCSAQELAPSNQKWHPITTSGFGAVMRICSASYRSLQHNLFEIQALTTANPIPSIARTLQHTKHCFLRLQDGNVEPMALFHATESRHTPQQVLEHCIAYGQPTATP